MAQQGSNTNHLPEVPPPWLLDLLQKYGEDEGILDGVPSGDGVPEEYQGHPLIADSAEEYLDAMSEDGEGTNTGQIAGATVGAVAEAAVASTGWDFMEHMETDKETGSEPEMEDDFEGNFDPQSMREDKTAIDLSSPEGLLSSMEANPSTSSRLDEEDDDPDWPMDLTASNNASALDAPATLDDASSMDDFSWLDELGSEGADATTAEAPSIETANDDFDWLNELGTEQSSVDISLDQSATGEPQAESDDDFDWLNQLRNEASSEVEGAAPDIQDEAPDWLMELEIADHGTPSSDSVSDTIAQDEGLEFERTPLDDNVLFSSDVSDVSSTDEEVPDWFAELQAEAEADVTSPSFDLPSSGRDADDSMASLSPDMPNDDVPPDIVSSDEVEETGLPDWMQEFDTDTPARDVTSHASEMIDEAAWLSELQPDTAANDASPTFDSSLEDTPDWLQDLEADVPLAEEGLDTLAAESNQSDWLDETSPPDTSTKSLDITDSLSWLDNLSEDASETPYLGPSSEEAEDDLDWLTSLSPDSNSITDETFISEISDLETNIDLAKETSGPSLINDDVPDWLNTLDEAQPVTEVEDIRNDPVVSDDLPGWLDSLDETKLGPEADDSMDWLAQLDVNDTTDRLEDIMASIGDEDSPLTWLDDMSTEEASIPLFSSTIDTTSPFEEDVRDEKQPHEADATPAGDLATAGLAAAIAGVGAGLAMPKDIQAGTQIDEDKDVAREFYDIAMRTNEPGLLTETETLPGLPRILRVSLNLIFVLLLAFPLFVHRTYQGYLLPWLLPDTRQQQLIRDEVQEAIITKPPNSVALVSFDYTPGTSGEMNPLALAVINQLLGQGLRVIAISLEPTGQAEAQKVFQQLDSERYQLGEHFLNLGYLPGGPVAIRNLTQDQPLAQLIEVQSGKSYASYEKWPAFQSIAEISLIVEISATPESPRWWAEQLYPATQQPMMAVVSAAAEPFVRPYRDSHQYEALIVGTNGAAALEIARIQQHTIGPATAMLDSQSVVHLIIMILMLLGTVAGLIEKYGQEVKVRNQNIDDLPPVSTEQSPSTPSLTKIQAQTEQTIAQGLQADINKIRQRQAPQIDEAIKTEQSRLLKQFLPIADNLARALDYPQQDKDTLLEGVALVQRQLMHVFETEGVRPIETHNQPFDPQLHEAIATVPANTISDDITLTNSHLGIIVEEVETGYQHDDKLLRPARVVVATSIN